MDTLARPDYGAPMSKRCCVWATIVLLGCSDDGVPADTDNLTSVSGDTSAPESGSGPGASTGGDDPTNATGPSSTSSATDPTIGEGSTGPDTSDSSTGGEERPGAPRMYVAGGNAVSVWEVDDAGALTEIQRVDQGSGVGPLADDDARFLYAARTGEQSVAAFSIDPISGALTEVGVTAVGHTPVYLSTDSTGSWLLSADFGADLVEVRPLEAGGTVGDTPSQSMTVQSRPHAIVFDPAGTHVFVPHRDSNLIEQYTFDDNTGTLTANEPASVAAPEGAGPRHIVFAPNASYAYVVNEFASSVTAYAYDAASGVLTQGDTVSALPPGFKGQNTGADIHVSVDGAYVYASMRGDDSLAVFTAGGDGSLTYQSNVPTEPRPRDFGLDPFGNFLYAAGQDSGMLAGYTIQADGSLTPTATYDAGADAQWVLGVELPAGR